MGVIIDIGRITKGCIARGIAFGLRCFEIADAGRCIVGCEVVDVGLHRHIFITRRIGATAKLGMALIIDRRLIQFELSNSSCVVP